MTPEEQRAQARAAKHRAHGVGHRLTDGQVDVVAVLVALDADHEDLRRAVSPLRVERLLQYVPGVGKSTVGLICRRARVDRGARIRELDAGRRGRLAEQLQRFDLEHYAGNGRVAARTDR